MRLRGVVGRVPLQLGLGTAERLVQSAAAALGRAFQIGRALHRNGRAAAEGSRRAAGERGRGPRNGRTPRVARLKGAPKEGSEARGCRRTPGPIPPAGLPRLAEEVMPREPVLGLLRGPRS